MAYTPRDWQNYAAGGTPLDEAALDHIEGGIKDAHAALAGLLDRADALESALRTYGVARLVWDGTKYPAMPSALRYGDYIGPADPGVVPDGSTWDDTDASDPTPSPTPNPTPSPTAITVNDTVLTYAGTWSVDTEHRSSAANSTAAIAVDVGATGGTVEIYATRDINRGQASVKVDGTQTQVIDEWAAAPAVGQKVATVTLGTGTHTVLITVLGTSVAGSTGTRVGIDYLILNGCTVSATAPVVDPGPAPAPNPTPDPTPAGTITHGSQVRRYNVGARMGIFGAQDTRTQVTSPAVIAGFTHTSGTRVIRDTRITGNVNVTGGRLELYNVWIDQPQPAGPYPSTASNAIHVDGGALVGSELTVIARNWLSGAVQVSAGSGFDVSSMLILGGGDGMQIAFSSPGPGNYYWPSAEDGEVTEFTGFSVRLQNFYIGDGYVEAGPDGKFKHSDGLQVDGGGGVIFKNGNIQGYRIHYPGDVPPTQRNNDGADFRSSAMIFTQPGSPKQIEDVKVLRCNFDGGSNCVNVWPTDGALPRRVYIYDCTRGTTETITGQTVTYGIPAAPAGTYVAVDRYGVNLGPGAPYTFVRNFTWLKTGKHIEVPHEAHTLNITDVVAGTDANV